MKLLKGMCFISITIAALAWTALSLMGIKAIVVFTAWLIEPEVAGGFEKVLGL